MLELWEFDGVLVILWFRKNTGRGLQVDPRPVFVRYVKRQTTGPGSLKSARFAGN